MPDLGVTTDYVRGLWGVLLHLSVRDRRAHTYVCRTCHATFSDPDAAYLHREAMHDRLSPAPHTP